MTPTEVWESFDANQAPLEITTVSSETTQNLVRSKQVFTAETTGAGKLRARCDLYYDDRWADARGALLVLPSLRNIKYEEELAAIVKEGYVACVLDYCGMDIDEPRTTFPDDLSFASYPECEKHLDEIENSARNTPWFVWAKIARRAITMLQEFPIVEKNSIGILGLGTGAEIAWQVAGIDKRLRALVAINGGGYRWAIKAPRFTSGNVLSTDEQRAYSTGVGAETYARLVTCPTLYISSRSSVYNDIDRAADMLDLVKSQTKQMIVSNAGGEQITQREFNALLDWLRRHFTLDESPVLSPTIQFESAEGKLYVRINSQRKATTKKLFINYGEPNSAYRFWHCCDLKQKVGAHEYICNIPVYNEKELIVAYATFEYADKTLASTKVIGAIPENLDIKGGDDDGLRRSRIIYDGNMGLGAFCAETQNAMLADDNLCVKKGPFDISGISAKEGNITLCRNKREMDLLSQATALHIDVYSPTERELEIAVYTYPDIKKYTARVSLQGGEFWQKVLLEYTDFKSDEGRTLTKFANAKILSVIDVNGIILNNFLWI